MPESSLSILNLIMSASLVVKGVLLLLLLASVWSWAIIFKKIKLLRSLRAATAQFSQQFWSGTDLMSLHHSTKAEQEGLPALFQSGFTTFLKMQELAVKTEISVENVERAMRVAFSRENDKLEENLSPLATIGSVSPYVGLFGTVWGIMSAFVALGGVEQATLSMVAPGIAEALIATAMGLFAAIPAVIFYNRFGSMIERELIQYENFQDEFILILTRQLEQKGRAL